ncbi:hypothetical protein QAD02_024154 [Eretmocerus hayati]|uniref:Uncharacterized protein n=1 Tax=Eretmocerus hayati TaxID=131215 RepID=A0ACC2PXL7_9HYME|nr:hypothetical protein QAD02_024154 [Eretmocerus hayati]
MKYLIELQQYRRCLFLFIAGFACSIVALAIHMIDPVKIIVQQKMKMTPTSYVFSLWKKPPIDVYVYVYIFNISNADAFLSGEDSSLKLNEIGPYVYQEILENQNVTWNKNGTISYMPRRTVIYRPDMSIGDPNDQYVTIPNIPLLGISSTLHNAGFFVNFPLIRLASALQSKPILNISVYDYLWGYEDSLVLLAGNILPSYINFRKFGLLDRMYDEGDNLVNMNIKENEDMTEEVGRYLSIESINGSPGLEKWGYVREEANETRPENKKCNRIQGASEGTVFPTHMDTRATFRIFRKAFCRPVPIAFAKEVKKNGVPGYLYTIPENFADPPDQNPENECYCFKGECMKKGLLELTPCYYNIPAAASFPHFLDADPTLANGIEGLHPDRKKHESFVILQPDIGIPMHVHSRLQTNLVMRETHYDEKIKRFNNLTIPLFWTDLTIPSLPTDIELLLKLGVVFAPMGQVAFVFILGLGGLSLICYALARLSLILQEEQRREAAAATARRDSRIPLGAATQLCTSIHILPAVKKFTSKSDLFS